MVGEDKPTYSLYGDTNMEAPIRLPGLDLVNPPSLKPEERIERQDEEREPPQDIFADLQRAIDAPAPPRVVSQTPQPPTPYGGNSDAGESSCSEEGGVSLPQAPSSAATAAAQRDPPTAQPQAFTYDQPHDVPMTNQQANSHPTFDYAVFQQVYAALMAQQPQHVFNQAWANSFAPYDGQGNMGPFAWPTPPFAQAQLTPQNNQLAQFGKQNVRTGAQSNVSQVSNSWWASINWQTKPHAFANGRIESQQAGSHTFSSPIHHSRRSMQARQTEIRNAKFNTYSSQTRYSLRSSQGRQARPASTDQRYLKANEAQITATAGPPVAIKNRHRQTLNLIPRPVPTLAYIQTTFMSGPRLATPKKLLIITDLNGTLLVRPDVHNRPKHCVPRPNLAHFLSYLFNNHAVMVWSSAREKNVKAMCNAIFTEEQRKSLVSCWARDTLRLSPAHFNQRVQVYKQLSWVWDDAHILTRNAELDQAESWDQTNTVLLDDSVAKAAAEPHNLVEIPEWEGQMEDDVLSQVAGYLEELKYAGNASQFMAKNPFEINKSWRYRWP